MNRENMTISKQAIASLRKSLAMTLEDFGALFGVSHSAVCLWEQGKRRPSRAAAILMQQKRAEVAAKKNLQKVS
jgi:DNA-binding transcriptional regulator YiaG